jgi:hypothetical protein
MSTGANQTPAGGLNPTPKPEQPAGGLKSVLKIAVPLGARFAIVFGLAFMTQYTPSVDPKDPTTKTTEGETGGEPPLRFFTSTRHWDPPSPLPEHRSHPLLAPSAVAPDALSFSLSDRLFQGVYEPSQDHLRRTQFWFENRNPKPVLMQLKHLSCGSCTGGRAASIPPETTRVLLQHAAIAALPIGPVNLFGVGLSQPAAALTLTKPEAGLPPLEWTEYGFAADPNATFRVAADTSTDKWAPQWGILELKFKVTAQPGDAPKPLEAYFAMEVEGAKQSVMNKFVIAFDVARPFDLSRPNIDAGKIDALTGDREFELIVYSATRGPGSEFGDLDPPSGSVEAPGGLADPVKFVEVTKVERIPESGLPEVAERLASDLKKLTRVRSAYRVTVVVRPRVGETRMDIGLMERTVSLTSGGATLTLPVKAMVRGPVWLEGDRTEFELPTFRGGSGLVQTVELTTEKTGLELAVVKDECQPSKFTYELEKLPDRGDRGYYKLKITIPPGQVFGAVKGMVVLEVKGPNPQRMRIPFRGTGTL